MIEVMSSRLIQMTWIEYSCQMDRLSSHRELIPAILNIWDQSHSFENLDISFRRQLNGRTITYCNG